MKTSERNKNKVKKNVNTRQNKTEIAKLLLKHGVKKIKKGSIAVKTFLPCQTQQILRQVFIADQQPRSYKITFYALFE